MLSSLDEVARAGLNQDNRSCLFFAIPSKAHDLGSERSGGSLPIALSSHPDSEARIRFVPDWRR